MPEMLRGYTVSGAFFPFWGCNASPFGAPVWIVSQRPYTASYLLEAMMAMEDSASEEKPKTTLPGTVEKIIKPIMGGLEKAQISVEGADDLYREIRIENVLKDEDGKKVALKPGVPVAVTIEADREDTTKKD
jgi:hypothetical protein